MKVPTLDPRLRSLLDKLAAIPQRVDWRGNIEVLRQQYWQAAHRFEAEAPALASIEPLLVDGAEGALKARLYTPFAAGAPSGPGLVFFHGGGWVLGDLDSHEMLCRRLAASSGARVLSVAYRLAPEHKFPAAVEDAEAATRFAFHNAATLGFDPTRIAIGGDSAGGNLSVVTTQTLNRIAVKDPATPKLKAQLLIYPCVQLVQMTPSQIRHTDGYYLTQAGQDFFKDKYLRTREDAFDPRVSPLLENDLSGLPPALVVTAGFDPLLDEGRAYADKLAACGVPVEVKNYPNQIHGFFNMTAVSSRARFAIEHCGAWLARML
jgi:acetyl esterase